jgi:hypothetical protein
MATTLGYRRWAVSLGLSIAMVVCGWIMLSAVKDDDCGG